MRKIRMLKFRFSFNVIQFGKNGDAANIADLKHDLKLDASGIITKFYNLLFVSNDSPRDMVKCSTKHL